MTVILTCLTHNFIVQAADRQLTLPDGSLYDDDANKAVFYCGRVAVAYTGLARIGKQETSAWLADRLKDASMIEPGMERIADDLNRYFRSSRERDKRIAFVATGWSTFRGRGPALPFYLVTSNFHSQTRGWLPAALPDVSLHLHSLPLDMTNVVTPAGLPLGQATGAVLTRWTRRCVQHETGPGAIARLLGLTIWGAAARSPVVGRGLVIQSLSKQALFATQPGIGQMFLTPITRDAHSFLYVSPDGKTDRFKVPLVACQGMVAEFFGGRIPRDDAVT